MTNNVLSVRMREPCQCKALCVINECLDGKIYLLSLSFDEVTLLGEAVSIKTAASRAIMAITAVVVLVTKSA